MKEESRKLMEQVDKKFNELRRTRSRELEGAPIVSLILKFFGPKKARLYKDIVLSKRANDAKVLEESKKKKGRKHYLPKVR